MTGHGPVFPSHAQILGASEYVWRTSEDGRVQRHETALTTLVNDPGVWARHPAARSMAAVRYEPLAPPIRPHLCIPITKGSETRVSLRTRTADKYPDEHPVKAMGALWRLRLEDIYPDPYAFQRSLRAPRVVWFRRGGVVGYVTPARTVLRDHPGVGG